MIVMVIWSSSTSLFTRPQCHWLMGQHRLIFLEDEVNIVFDENKITQID